MKEVKSRRLLKMTVIRIYYDFNEESMHGNTTEFHV